MLKKVYTPNAPEAVGPYSQALVAMGLVFTSGQIPINPVTNTVDAVTIEAQTEQALKNLQAVLEAAGTSLDKVIKTTCFLVDMDDFAAFNGVYSQFFIHDEPARSCVAVRELPKGVMVEVEAIALLGS